VKKVCNICREEKELCDFGMDNTRKSGVSNRYGCKQCDNERSKKYYIKNREKQLSRRKEYRIKNKEKIQSQKKEYYINNREKQLSREKEYQIKNRKNINVYEKNRRLNDPIFKLTKNVRNRLRQYLKTTGIAKSKTTFDIVGCSPPELKEHLEKQFTEGMSWNNRGEWHIDHIIPLSSAKTEDELYRLCHYTNLQPLWAEDNIKKSNKILLTD
jgi:hypothetical protein